MGDKRLFARTTSSLSADPAVPESLQIRYPEIAALSPVRHRPLFPLILKETVFIINLLHQVEVEFSHRFYRLPDPHGPYRFHFRNALKQSHHSLFIWQILA